MLRGAIYRGVVFAVLIGSVAGCHSSTSQEQMQAAQNDLLSEARALQQCETDKGYGSVGCAERRATYAHDLAAFRAKYGR
jgi:Flp pilus assembly protein TadD